MKIRPITALALSGIALVALNCSCSSDDEPKREDVKYSLAELNEGFSRIDANGNKIQGIADSNQEDVGQYIQIREDGSSDVFVHELNGSAFQIPSSPIVLEFIRSDKELKNPQTPLYITLLPVPVDVADFADKNYNAQQEAWGKYYTPSLTEGFSYPTYPGVTYDEDKFGKVNYWYNDDEMGNKFSVTIPENKTGHPRLIEIHVYFPIAITPNPSVSDKHAYRFLQY
ncbi:MAG: hypothetical protein NC194_04910 [Prevotella sp.]|nr:hypothetical protein [Prevotella sp.]